MSIYNSSITNRANAPGMRLECAIQLRFAPVPALSTLLLAEFACAVMLCLSPQWPFASALGSELLTFPTTIVFPAAQSSSITNQSPLTLGMGATSLVNQNGVLCSCSARCSRFRSFFLWLSPIDAVPAPAFSAFRVGSHVLEAM
jgi:hypothetical protein